MLERQEAEASKPAQEVILDNTNEVSFPDYPYKFRAVHEMVIVSIDIFKSGLECKVCNGKKRIQYQCACEKEGRPGYKFSLEQLDAIRESLGYAVWEARQAIPCPECAGHPETVAHDESCTACKGIGHILIVPESAKNLPSTGVVLSMGREAREKAEFKVGDRILFGQHSGSFIPLNNGILLKRLDWYAAYSIVTGADAMGAFDFIMQE
jgi:co-chaperonin GroES (HSP10)